MQVKRLLWQERQVRYLLNNQSDEIRPSYSFGETPSPQIRQLDHSTWWAAFMSLVGSMPRKAESSRLSDDPVHVVHGQYFSVRDCAMRAIDAAYAENLTQVAREYEEQAKQLIFSYDKRVFIRVSRVFDRQRMKYLVICTSCLLLSVLLAFVNSIGEKGSTGLFVLIIITVIFAAVSAVMASLTTWRKRKILNRPTSRDNNNDAGESVIKTEL